MSAQLLEPVGKTCTTCRQDRPIGRFPHSKFTDDGRTDRCLDCISAAAQQSRLQREMRRPAPSPKRTKPKTGRRPSKAHAERPTIYA